MQLRWAKPPAILTRRKLRDQSASSKTQSDHSNASESKTRTETPAPDCPTGRRSKHATTPSHSSKNHLGALRPTWSTETIWREILTIHQRQQQARRRLILQRLRQDIRRLALAAVWWLIDPRRGHRHHYRKPPTTQHRVRHLHHLHHPRPHHGLRDQREDRGPVSRCRSGTGRRE